MWVQTVNPGTGRYFLPSLRYNVSGWCTKHQVLQRRGHHHEQHHHLLTKLGTVTLISRTLYRNAHITGPMATMIQWNPQWKTTFTRDHYSSFQIHFKKCIINYYLTFFFHENKLFAKDNPSFQSFLLVFKLVFKGSWKGGSTEYWKK